MKSRAIILALAICFFFIDAYAQSPVHEIIFCGEKIPVSDRFVADKLMDVIRKQIPYVNLPRLREAANKYFGIVESYLKATGLPEDLKYLAIVESGFRSDAVSRAKAAGFWQIMPATARDWGLNIDEPDDERKDIYKSTHAACKELARNYLNIRKNYGISSWVLTAAAYNNGIGKMITAINKQGNNYFQMNLNPETAVYVYKIIAVKELFEYPELYMKNFGYNVFAASSKPAGREDVPDVSTFSSMTVKVDQKDASHTNRLDTSIILDKKNIKNYVSQNQNIGSIENITFVRARIIGKYKEFNDGDLVSFELLDNLQIGNSFTAKGMTLRWRGWTIDDRVYIDLGFGHNVILYDLQSTHGVSLASLKEKEVVIIRVNNIDG